MDFLQESREDLKRADHLLYVSLKYTRTVDVIRSIVMRLISSIGYSIELLLKNAKDKKKIKEIPPQTGLKCEIVKKVYNDPKITEMVEFYLLLRKISKAEYKKTNEYRRHVTMIATIDKGILDINMDLIKEFYQKTNEYVDYVESITYPKKE
ncbi:hypothetical protein HYU11_01370 [Candidatus Woesearchaeota archaeon]|nr:hypothetical protein [Candidatus Woesearchaeota archaeon]